MSAKIMKSSFSASSCFLYILHFMIVNFLYGPASNTSIHALPITSKPIDSTAENLAWQAWLLLPPDQKSQEKSRKVTPKSIFTLPLRDCPPGYKQLETNCGNDCPPGQQKQSRCVKDCPTGYRNENGRCILQCPPGYKLHNLNCISQFEIDLSELLNKEINQIIGDNSNIYDYEDDEFGAYNLPQSLSAETASEIGSNYDDRVQLPSRDEPLKFNIFEQKFPTDYGAAIDEDMFDIENSNKTNYDEAVPTDLATSENQKPGTSLNKTKDDFENPTSTKDMQSEGTYIFSNSEIETTTKATKTSLGTIDAISVPATNYEHEKFLFMKDDSSVQIISTAITPSLSEHTLSEANDQKEIQQLFKDGHFLPVNNATIIESNHTLLPSISRNDTEQTSDFALETDYIGDSTLNSQTNDDFGTTTMGAAASDSSFVRKSDNNETINFKDIENEKKIEHVRSILASATSSDNMKAQETDFTTTSEPDSTTNIQLDETTIIEAYAAPTIIFHEIAQHLIKDPSLQQQFDEDETHVVLKKSKVEPVDDCRNSTKSTSTQTPPSTAVPNTIKSTTTAATTNTDAYPNKPLSIVLPKPKQQIQQQQKQQDDRFYYKHLQDTVDSKEGNGQRKQPQYQEPNKKPLLPDEKNIMERRSSSESVNAAITGSRNPVTPKATATITTAIPMDTTTTYVGNNKHDPMSIEEELRIINDLVKGKRKSTTTASKTPTTSATESNKFATTAESSFTSGINVIYTSTVDIRPTATTVKTILTSASTYTDGTAVTKANTKIENNQSTAQNPTTFSLLSNTMPMLSSVESTLPTSSSSISTTTDRTYQLNKYDSVADPISTSASLPSYAVGTTTVASSNSNASVAKTKSINSTRSLRNSKIIRFDNNNNNSNLFIKANPKVAKTTNAIMPGSSTTNTATTTSVSTTPSSNVEVNEVATTTERAGGTAANENANFDAFWWLPIGWHLDNTPDTAKEDTPFYLRFWSSFSDSSGTSSNSNSSSRGSSSSNSSSSGSSSTQTPK